MQADAEAGGVSAPPTSDADNMDDGDSDDLGHGALRWQSRDTGTVEDVTMDNDQEGPRPGPHVQVPALNEEPEVSKRVKRARAMRLIRSDEIVGEVDL